MPLSPKETMDKKTALPKEVFEVVDALLVEKFDGVVAVISKNEIINRLLDKMKYFVSEEDVIKKGWLNIIPSYEHVGWIVFYDQPDFDETYSPYFHFSVKKSRVR